MQLKQLNQEQFIEDMTYVMKTMLTMDNEIGEIWKWPPAKDCFKYAITESAELLEEQILTERPNDSRNNKQAGDYNAATEAFDVSMMLLRGLLVFEEYYGFFVFQPATMGARVLFLQDRIKSHINNEIIEYDNDPRWHDVELMWADNAEDVCYNTAAIVQYCKDIEMYMSNGEEDEDGGIDLGDYVESCTSVVDSTFSFIVYTLSSLYQKYFDKVSYRSIAEAKLDKILTKNLAKKVAQNESAVNN